MDCLFCDQTPETNAAREKLYAISKLLNCSLVGVITSVQSILTENAYLKMQQESYVRDRDQWREEAHKHQRYARYRDYNESKTPTVYMRPGALSRERWEAAFDEVKKAEAIKVPEVVPNLIGQLEALPKGKK